ncbi:MAG: hypothetical protein SFY80_14430 [Verrucomicrobiota bacterium]|nr:hypothetical protein [Verrucomicrobiota bacterium]
MRNYLYIWADKVKNYIVASGIEFSDIAPFVENIILLKHEYDEAEFDLSTKFEFTSKEKIIQDNPYKYGDFCWVDFNGNTISKLDKNSIASLLISHTRRNHLMKYYIK